MNRFSSTHKFGYLLTGVVLTAAAVSASTGWAEPEPVDYVEVPDAYGVRVYRSPVIELGGGVQYIDLPDMRWTFLTNNNGEVEKKQKNGDLSDYGGAASGTIYVPVRGWAGTPVTFVASGFFSEVDNNHRTRCESTNDLNCTVQDIVDIPNQLNSWSFPSFFTKTSREVEYWGATAEATFGPGHGQKSRRYGGFLFDYYHGGIGFNVRGLDQDNRIRLHADDLQNPIRYDETLDTTYYGGYLSVTGEFNILGYLGIGSNWNIRSFATFRGGVYGTDTDYTGRFTLDDQLTSHLRLSDDEVAFIGGASFETRLPICNRTSLSLVTDYEYLSYVPRMRYAAGEGNNAVNVTRIDDDDALFVRTQIRFNIGFGPDEHYDEVPLK